VVGHANYRTAKVLDYLERTRVPNPFEQTDLYPLLMLGELVQTTAGKWITHLTIPMPQRLIALIEIPQACSLKFLTCEQRSV